MCGCQTSADENILFSGVSSCIKGLKKCENITTAVNSVTLSSCTDINKDATVDMKFDAKTRL